MSDIFLQILNMSITASWLVLAVLLLRFALKKAPKWIHCLLWGMVALRLTVPFSLQSVFSLIPSAEPIPSGIGLSHQPAINSGIPVINDIVNPMIAENLTPSTGDIVNPMEVVLFAGAVLWALGTAIMLIYGLISYNRLYWKVRVKLCLYDNIYLSDDIETPFLLGMFCPGIYIPSEIPEQQRGFIIAHEQAHLKRGDHWWKFLGFTLLSIYWFNPLMWVSYILLCRDIESACDEKVIKSMCMADKKGYSQALLTCSVQHSTSLANPIAFGEVGVKGRIRSVLRYEHPGLRVIAGAMALCLVVGACFLTDPVGAQDLGTERIGKITDYQSFEAEMSKRIDLHTYQVTDSSYSYAGERICRYRYQAKRHKGLPEKASNYQIKVGDTHIGIPLTVADMGARGWVVTKVNGMAATKYNVSSWVYEAELEFQNDRGEVLQAYARNKVQNCQSRLDQCTILRLDFPVQKPGVTGFPCRNEFQSDVTVFGSITQAASLDQIVSVLGYPQEMQYSVTVDEKTGEAKGSSLHLTYHFGYGSDTRGTVEFVVCPNLDRRIDAADYIQSIQYNIAIS